MENIEGESLSQDVGTQPTDYQEEVSFTQPTEYEEVTEPGAPTVSFVCAEDPTKSLDVKYEKGKSATLGSSEGSHIRMAGEFISRAMGTFDCKNSGIYFKIQGQNGGRLERAGYRLFFYQQLQWLRPLPPKLRLKVKSCCSKVISLLLAMARIRTLA